MVKRVNGGARPKLVDRKGGWTQAKRSAFLEELAQSCNVALACRVAKVHSGAVYRERQANAAFRAGWAQALSEGYARLEMMLLKRAMDGTVKPMRRAGGDAEKVSAFCERLALQLLKQHKDGAAQAQAAETESDDEAAQSCARIMRKVDGVRRRLGLPDDSEEGAGETA